MTIKNFLQLLIISLLLSCSSQERSEDFCPEYIAHAGGAIDSCIYTNSREAMENAYADGFRFLEFDLLFTCDSVLVAAHSWGEFNEMTDSTHLGERAPSFRDFSSRKILGKYTPMSADEINAFFLRHDSLYLVTDKISQPDVLQEYFPDIRERMVVEAFSFQDYCRLKSQGYYRVLYSCMADDLLPTLLSTSINDIEWMALHTSAFENYLFRLAAYVKQFKIALFTVNDLDSIPLEHRGMVKMMYTDFLQPYSGLCKVKAEK